MPDGATCALQGARATLRGVTINAEHRGAVSASDNTIGGNLRALKNTGGVMLTGNRIPQNMQRKENSPAPAGGGNTAGSKAPPVAATGGAVSEAVAAGQPARPPSSAHCWRALSSAGSAEICGGSAGRVDIAFLLAENGMEIEPARCGKIRIEVKRGDVTLAQVMRIQAG